MKQAFPSGFSVVERDRGEHRYSLVLEGELDMARAPALRDRVTSLCRRGAREIEIDLAGVTFIDSGGLRTMILVLDLCEEHKTELFVVAPALRNAMKVFELTGTAHLFSWRVGTVGDPPPEERASSFDSRPG